MTNTTRGTETIATAVLLAILALSVETVAAQSPVEVRAVPIVRGPERRCRIDPHTPGTDSLSVACDIGTAARPSESGSYCYQSGRIPDGRYADYRLFLCPNLGAGLQLLAVTTADWELVGARLYATGGGARRPLGAQLMHAVAGDGRGYELLVLIPAAGDDWRWELLSLRDRELIPILSTDYRRIVRGVTTETSVQQTNGIPGDVLILVTLTGSRRALTFRVARWNGTLDRFDVSPVCPNGQPFLSLLGWTSDGRHTRLLGIRAPPLSASERRDGWRPRYETTWIGWTTGLLGCPALIVRTRTLVERPGVVQERDVLYQIIDVHPQSRRLRVVEREVPIDDPRIVAALATEETCDRAVECCTAADVMPPMDMPFLRNNCLESRRTASMWPSAEAARLCAERITGYRARLQASGREIPRACEPGIPPEIQEQIQRQLEARDAPHSPRDSAGSNARFAGTWEGGRPDPDESLELELREDSGALAGTLTVTSGETWRCPLTVVQPAATREPLVSFRCVCETSGADDGDPIVSDETRCVLTLTEAGSLRFDSPTSPACNWAGVELRRRAAP